MMYNSQITKDRIRQLCKEKNINAKQMLIECALGANAIQQINDTKGMASYSLAMIADYLDCSVDYLLGRTDEKELNITKESDGEIKMAYNDFDYRLLLSDNGIRKIREPLKLKIQQYGEERFYNETGLTLHDYKAFLTNDVELWGSFLSKFDTVLAVLETNLNDLFKLAYTTPDKPQYSVKGVLPIDEALKVYGEQKVADDTQTNTGIDDTPGSIS